jgi:hypothetical protein
VAAGGTVLALATVSATADAAAPMAALASHVDPIFALIEEYRAAAETLTAACSEHSRREKMLIELGFGLNPFISVLDVAGPRAPQPVLVYKLEYVDVPFHPPATGHADLEAGSRTEMPILQEGPLCAARSHDQVDRDAGDHAVSVGASGMRSAKARFVL